MVKSQKKSIEKYYVDRLLFLYMFVLRPNLVFFFFVLLYFYSVVSFMVYTFPLLLGLSLPCKCHRCWCCGPTEICCQKNRILKSLDTETALQAWDQQLKRIKREEMERMLNDMFL